MNFEEHASKALLKGRGLPVPDGFVAGSPEAAADAARALGGPCVVKAQAPTGKRGKAGGIRLAASPDEARAAAADILGMTIGGHRIERLLVEEQVPIAAEFYAAVLNDPASRGPVVLFSATGGMEVEEMAAGDPEAMRRIEVDIAAGLTARQTAAALAGLDLNGKATAVAEFLTDLYDSYRALDAELLEINPLALTEDGRVVCLDCKFTLDDASTGRQAAGEAGSPEPMTALEVEAHQAGLKYIELDGSVGVLANGAGLTMATMDAIEHFGGRPANFLEIGGEAYTKAETALTILLGNPNIRALLVNFCGAFARTDVMAEGVVRAWQKLDPGIPVFFTIHGTGEDEAVALVESELGHRPYDLMDDAVRAAVGAAGGSAAREAAP
ncbi:MAG: succinate--CoA ligase [Rhodospirillaceae bacterium]|nr:succinate--CoA ligase [Rhodospirillaceae bacterium]MYF86134.1 succinate--CoA ligase [Rhodospirillaceae bacterium]MYH36617.1 succinate--CoA ligase [Rhodospirillaceae bacterium]MYK13477.1 succinate--CoA ligase [Rhodospirillaceae bacterium]MYK58553.1 succinate--CoA ligase [Rhodospirillaceae bacterium]